MTSKKFKNMFGAGIVSSASAAAVAAIEAKRYKRENAALKSAEDAVASITSTVKNVDDASLTWADVLHNGAGIGSIDPHSFKYNPYGEVVPKRITLKQRMQKHEFEALPAEAKREFMERITKTVARELAERYMGMMETTDGYIEVGIDIEVLG